MIKLDSIKLKGHGSFYLREGWITKGLVNIDAFKSEYPTDELGVGSAMVTSIKYYLLTMGLIKYNKSDKNYVLTEIGKVVLENDKYIEGVSTIWLLHYLMIKNKKDATIWNLFFNRFSIEEFSRQDAEEFFIREIVSGNPELKFSESSLRDDVKCILKSYVKDNHQDTPENNYFCPFSELGLIKTINRSTRSDVIFKKSNPSLDIINNELLLYVIIDNLSDEEKDKGISVDSLVNNDNNIGKVFNLDRNMIINLIENLVNDGYVTFNKTAGLNMVYIKNEYLQDNEKIKLLNNLKR